MTWDGKERREGMSNDWIERDRLLSEVHSDVKHIVQWAKEHHEDDDRRFKIVGDRVSWIEKIAYTGLGGISLLIIILKMVK